jgi:hypothetical protein
MADMGLLTVPNFQDELLLLELGIVSNLLMKKESEAYIEHGIFNEKGLGTVVVCRYKSNGTAEVGVFLVDVWCLGVKSAFFTLFDSPEDRDFKLDFFFRGDVPLPESAANGRRLIEGAVAYAQSLGIAPSADYKKGARVFGGINVKDATRNYTFGKNGKPFYISGPHDDTDKILRILTNRLGVQGVGAMSASDPFGDFLED